MTNPHAFVLGGVANLKYNQSKVSLHPGDILFMYTDGVTEAADIKGKLFSQEKLEKLVLKCAKDDIDIQNLVSTIRSEIDKFAGEAERSDDITMLAFKNFKIDERGIDNK